jgi:DNA polymerase-3 subunit beta
MLFQTPVAAFLEALAPVARVVDARTTIPILSHVRLIARSGELWLTASDLDREAEARLELNVEAEGETTISASKLVEIARSLPKAATLRFTVDERPGVAVLTSGRARFTLSTLPASDFPALGDAPFPCAFRWPAQKLAEDWACVSHAISSEETRYYLNGIHLCAPHGRIVVVATDGHRLARIETDIEAPELSPIIVPTATVKEIIRRAGALDKEAHLDFQAAPTRLRVKSGETSLTSKLIDGTFPDYERVIPRDFRAYGEASSEAISAALARVRIAATAQSARVKFDFGDRLKLEVGGAETSATDEIEIDSEGGEMSIGFNSRYAAEAVQALDSPRVKFSLIDPGTPAHLSAPGRPDRIVVLMPLRI